MTLSDLRAQYEKAVLNLRAKADKMRAASASPKAIAREVHADRRRLAASFKERMPEPMRSRIYSRTAAVYGDPLGPTIDHLSAKGRSWEEIVASAVRPGRACFFDEARLLVK